MMVGLAATSLGHTLSRCFAGSYPVVAELLAPEPSATPANRIAGEGQARVLRARGRAVPTPVLHGRLWL